MSKSVTDVQGAEVELGEGFPAKVIEACGVLDVVFKMLVLKAASGALKGDLIALKVLGEARVALKMVAFAREASQELIDQD